MILLHFTGGAGRFAWCEFLCLRVAAEAPDLTLSAILSELMDRARASREDLEVEVFKANALGRAFYARYGFKLMQEKTHEETGFEVMRLRLVAS